MVPSVGWASKGSTAPLAGAGDGRTWVARDTIGSGRQTLTEHRDALTVELGQPGRAAAGARRSASPGPDTSGPLPCDQSTSVATRRSPATRCFAPTKPPSQDDVQRRHQPVLRRQRRGRSAGADVLVVDEVVDERLVRLDDLGDALLDVVGADRRRWRGWRQVGGRCRRRRLVAGGPGTLDPFLRSWPAAPASASYSRRTCG